MTGYDIVLHADLTQKLTDIRKGHGYEGEVLYFIDKDGEVIGLLKKKTIWYEMYLLNQYPWDSFLIQGSH